MFLTSETYKSTVQPFIFELMYEPVFIFESSTPLMLVLKYTADPISDFGFKPMLWLLVSTNLNSYSSQSLYASIETKSNKRLRCISVSSSVLTQQPAYMIIIFLPPYSMYTFLSDVGIQAEVKAFKSAYINFNLPSGTQLALMLENGNVIIICSIKVAWSSRPTSRLSCASFDSLGRTSC